MNLFIVVTLVFIPTLVIGIYSEWAKQRFRKSFEEKCLQYEWVRDYINRASKLRKEANNRYAIFIFDDHHTRARKGGLGDRMGGLITVFAWALRTNRTFLIESNKNGFGKIFQPFLSKDSITINDENSYNWNDWKLWNYNERSIDKSKKTYLWCYNPKPRSNCGLDGYSNNQDPLDKYDEVRIRINRCYLCRWVENKELPAYKEIRSLLNIKSDTNLFDISGCIMRLVMWPTEYLWQQIDKVFSNNNYHKPIYQIGVHFRCGDHNYKHNGALLHPEIMNYLNCIVRKDIPWNGTHAVDELSLESPIDSGLCVKSIINNYNNNYNNYNSNNNNNNKNRKKLKTIVFIASDSIESANQINKTINYPNTIMSPPGCHIDYDNNPMCTIDTITYWFILSISHISIFQTFIDNNNSLFSSSFARYSMIYSLKQQTNIYPSSCHIIKNNNELLNKSRLSQGNWVCSGGQIY